MILKINNNNNNNKKKKQMFSSRCDSLSLFGGETLPRLVRHCEKRN